MKNYWELSITLPNQTNQEVVEEFLLSLKIANHSKGTIELYRWFLERFFSKQTKTIDEITSNEIIEWYRTNEGHVSEKTLQLRLNILWSFYKFCVKEEHLEKSPMKSRWFPRLPQPLPKYLSKEEVAKTRQKVEKHSLRNQLIYEFLLSSGCRLSELIRLNKSDIDLENRIARVTGKGNKIREIHFSEKCLLLLERYLNSRNDDNQALFIKENGERLRSRRTIQRILTNLGEEAELNSSLHPHRLRHTFATELLTKGAELSFIADELGHSSISTTQIYARVPNQEIIALYRKYMG